MDTILSSFLNIIDENLLGKMETMLGRECGAKLIETSILILN